MTGPAARPGDPGTPSIARVYDYLLGGTDWYEADRQAALALAAAKPEVAANMRANRAFLGRVVQHLAGPGGITQFLDIGAGIPGSGNTHEVAQQVSPAARVVYVDNDPDVLARGRAMLASTPEGAAGYVQADLRDPARILALAGRWLDLARPAAVLLLGILHLIPGDEPYPIVSFLTQAMAPGSYLAISHPASDIRAASADSGARVYSSLIAEQANRTRAEVARFSDGLDLVPPGVVPANQWRPRPGTDTAQVISNWASLGRRP